MKKFSSFLVLLSAVQLFSGSVQAAEQQGNLFQCEGKNFEVSYSTTSFFGQPNYSVKDLENGVSIDLANRKDIKNTVTPMGNLVTATYFKLALADGPTYHYSLVIPAHELGMAESLKLETQMIRTTVVSPFRPHGMSMQIQHSEIFPVSCVAQRVFF